MLSAVAHSRRLNLHFLGFKEEDKVVPKVDEKVIPKIQTFLIQTLGIQEEVVKSMLIRDAHRLGVVKPGMKYPRPIIVGFILMEDRNLIFSKAYKCKNTNYAIRVDLPPELVDVRSKHLEIRDDIRKINPDALVSCSYRAYRPVLLVKYRGKVQQYDPAKMKIKDLQPADPRIYADPHHTRVN